MAGSPENRALPSPPKIKGTRMPNRSDSRRVRGSDVRAVLRLVREACELGEDALAWRSHVLEGLDPLSRPVQLPGLFRFL